MNLKSFINENKFWLDGYEPLWYRPLPCDEPKDKYTAVYGIALYIVWVAIYRGNYTAFSNDLAAAMLVSQNNKTAAMLVFQTSPVGVDSFLM